jgi:hypothetical protein
MNQRGGAEQTQGGQVRLRHEAGEARHAVLDPLPGERTRGGQTGDWQQQHRDVAGLQVEDEITVGHQHADDQRQKLPVDDHQGRQADRRLVSQHRQGEQAEQAEPARDAQRQRVDQQRPDRTQAEDAEHCVCDRLIERRDAPQGCGVVTCVL